MINIFLSIQSKKKEVIAFLDELKALLEKDDFDIDTDLTLIKKKKKGEDGYVPLPVKIAIAREIYGKTMAKILEVTGDVNQNHTYNVINYASVQQIENDRGSVYEAPVVSLEDGKTIDAEFEETNEPDTVTS